MLSHEVGCRRENETKQTQSLTKHTNKHFNFVPEKKKTQANKNEQKHIGLIAIEVLPEKNHEEKSNSLT